MYDISRIPEHVEYHEALGHFSSIRVPKKTKPVLAFCGPSRCGKDTACQYLSDRYGYTFFGSNSRTVCPYIAASNGVSVEDAYNNRHQHREYWFEYCNYLRRNDPTLIVRMNLQNSDCISGIRGKPELEACLRLGIIDAAIWIDRDVERDPTLEYGVESCTEILPNRSTELSFYEVLDYYMERRWDLKNSFGALMPKRNLYVRHLTLWGAS